MDYQTIKTKIDNIEYKNGADFEVDVIAMIKEDLINDDDPKGIFYTAWETSNGKGLGLYGVLDVVYQIVDRRNLEHQLKQYKQIYNLLKDKVSCQDNKCYDWCIFNDNGWCKLFYTDDTKKTRPEACINTFQY